MTADQQVDLTNCDREPIHIPGSIQPHGCLLSCDVSAKTVQRHSANSNAILQLEGPLNGRLLADLVGAELAHEIRNALSRAMIANRPALLFGQCLENGHCFDIAVHSFKGNAILEFEPAEVNVAQPLELARAMISRLTQIESVDRLVNEAARLVQVTLGYDRVMIYRFVHDGAGKVVSEARQHDLESFLGQYFPASDIPQQARALYLKNTIRIISDANFERIPLNPDIDASGEPLDLSYAHLRSVSPIHCEYLRNMGVGASMSISIIVDGALWGLIACHHYGPRTLSMAQRVAAEMFGDFFSLHLNALQHKQTLDAAQSARDALDGFLRDAVGVADIHQAFGDKLTDFRKLIACDGIGMWIEGRLHVEGSIPPDEAIKSLARFAEPLVEGSIWATHKLADVIPEAEGYSDRAAGVLIVPLSHRPRDYLFFFRKEIVQTLNWAGNPDKTYETGPHGDRLTPRKSFAIWKETVHLQSTPWTEHERRFAEAIRAALVEVILQNTELLADERAKAEVRQRMLNEELNHRVKNILAVIRSLVVHRTNEGDTLESYVTSLKGRIQALSHAHDQVIRSEGGGSLHDLLEAELTPYLDAAANIDLSGPPVWMESRAFSIMALVLHELSTNAAKYGALSTQGGHLAVRWQMDEIGACSIQWTETGGPPVKMPSRQGFGSVLINRSIPFDLGGKSDIDFDPGGLKARFLIPSRFVGTNQMASSDRKSTTPQPATPSRVSLSGKHVLIVEDQLLIAMDLEQMLESEGLVVDATVTSVRQALAFLEEKHPDLAVLDINLGNETSEPIASALRLHNVPFVFATGYGDDGAVPTGFSGVPIVRKPYDKYAVLSALGELDKGAS